MNQRPEHFLVQMARLFTLKQLLLAGLFLLYFSWILSWKLAVILMGALMFHELGHAWAMRRYGLRIKGFYFAPPFGLVVVTTDACPTRQAEAVIGLMGPAWGLIMTLATYGVYLATGNPVFAGLTAWFALLNAFNLLPANPLDGGRVVKSLAFSASTRLGFAILIAGLALTIWLAFNFNPILGLLVFWMGTVEFRHELRQIRRGRDRRQIIRVLAEELRTAENAGDIVDRLQSEVDRIRSMRDVREHLTDPEIEEIMERGLDCQEVLLGQLLIPLTYKALEARRPYAPLFWGEWQYATEEEEMLPLDLGRTVRDSPLGKFLLEADLPGMKSGGAALTLLAYLGLAGILLILFTVASQAMTLMGVIDALR